mmetsp:Transcript_28603/g.42289  ORF Transcript_28603/g.42289 Transcript_28603/m.42289 type:complete len:366 (-) Transcript_28603:93-1190(-)|eukprot:CAMPEP_0194226346 /NCGR_PEP_ID=MMETSP0156-20130528/41656_1 /TAXON_ID=33649 /ORGANISM="Thalassionema nitzschioides, Strain L26-B" /LENGTH=365 /DNA_ID=CAMNT_0038958675 /DNA_START=96 /DNA_END=1193 /DNA_ORIENTATION=+
MRRSGSSSCMLKPKAVLSTQEEQGEKLSVTMVNNKQLPSYSTERFYMLSEIEQNAFSISYLCDHDCDGTAETASESDIDDCHFPSYILLYILWRPEMAASPRALTEGVIQKSVNQLKSLTDSKNKNIYLVVETLVRQVSRPDCPLSISEKQKQKTFLYKHQVDVADQLARCVTQNKTLRFDLQGLTVGICDHVRAAPGLEACMDAMILGSRERRKGNCDIKSSIGIVALHPDDLLGLDPIQETDAAQDVLQSLTCCEWNGNGDLLTFAKRAHLCWCTSNKIELKEERSKRKIVPLRRRQRNAIDQDFTVWDPIAIFLILFIAAWFYLHMRGLVTSSEDGLGVFFHRIESIFTTDKEAAAEKGDQL